MCTTRDCLIRRNFTSIVLFALLCNVCFSHQILANDALIPNRSDRWITKLLANLLPKWHISSKPLDDQLSQRALSLFLDSVDPSKRYFYQSDYDEFIKYKTDIDDLVAKGDLSVSQQVYRRFLRRVDERVTVALEILASPLDFQKRESIVTDTDTLRFAKDASEARDRWRRLIKYDLLTLKDKGIQGPKAIKRLSRRYKRDLKRHQQLDRDDLLEIFLSSVTRAYDPHTAYWSRKTLENFQMAMRLNLEGIGAELREKEGVLTVMRVTTGGAAHKHGKLKRGDQIVSVGQDAAGPMVDVEEMSVGRVAEMIRGKAGTTVRLGVKPGGVGEEQIYEMVRVRIELKDQAARSEVISHQIGNLDPKVNIGYISLPSFYIDSVAARQNKPNYRSCVRDVQHILKEFKTQNVDCVLLDLTANGGGDLQEAVRLTGLFIDQGPVVQIKNGNGAVRALLDNDRGVVWDGPLVVMTSQLSASASEIVAGAIRDYRRGIIVGDPKTHGKGTVQSVQNICFELLRKNETRFGALKVTIQQFYLPSGESTQKQGVPADIVLPSLTAHMDVGEADLEYAMEYDRVKRMNHQVYKMVPDALILQLRAQSEKRISQNEAFLKRRRRIKSYLRIKQETSRSLFEQDFFAVQKELKRQDANEDELEDLLDSVGEIYSDNFYNQEVLNISLEYTNALLKQHLARTG